MFGVINQFSFHSWRNSHLRAKSRKTLLPQWQCSNYFFFSHSLLNFKRCSPSQNLAYLPHHTQSALLSFTLSLFLSHHYVFVRSFKISKNFLRLVPWTCSWVTCEGGWDWWDSHPPLRTDKGATFARSAISDWIPVALENKLGPVVQNVIQRTHSNVRLVRPEY